MSGSTPEQRFALVGVLLPAIHRQFCAKTKPHGSPADPCACQPISGYPFDVAHAVADAIFASPVFAEMIADAEARGRADIQITCAATDLGCTACGANGALVAVGGDA